MIEYKPMVQSKIETFTAMLAEQPEDATIWYGLAVEQYKLENWAEAAKLPFTPPLLHHTCLFDEQQRQQQYPCIRGIVRPYHYLR